MIITAIKTRALLPPKDDLRAAISAALPALAERSVLAITSKVVGIDEGRCIAKKDVPDKDELIKKESDRYLSRDFVPNRWVMHTVKHGVFIPSAGVDESNANEHYILWPRDPQKSAESLRRWACEHYKIKELGIIVTDSHTIPLRRGTLGISLGWCGFTPIRDYRGETDIFGRQFAIQIADIADGIAAAAVLVMGEGRETTPAAVITDVPFVEFTDRPYAPEKPFSSFQIEAEEDLYYPLFSQLPWQKGGSGI